MVLDTGVFVMVVVLARPIKAGGQLKKSKAKQNCLLVSHPCSWK